MTARGLCLVLFLGHGISTAQAHFPIAPYLAGALGGSDVRTRIPVQTSPPTVASFAEHNGNVLGAITVGITTFGPHFAADAALRSTLEIGQPFRVLTLGPAVRWGQRVQVHLRGALTSAWTRPGAGGTFATTMLSAGARQVMRGSIER